MSAADLKNFLTALDKVKQDYICGICREICKQPVVLKKCFHWICAEHQDLKQCPKCNIPVDDAETFVDDRITRCIEYHLELERIFEKFRPKNDNKSNESLKITDEVSNNPAKPSEKVTKSNPKKPLTDKTNSRADINQTLTSNISSTIRSKEKRNTKGETPLHAACRLGKIAQIKELLSSGANTNTKDNAGWTPLHELVQNGKLDLVQLILQYNTLINVPGQGNETPLHEAIRYNHINIAEVLVKHGADMNARNCKGETPYQLASSNVKNILLAAADNIIQTQGVNVSSIAAVYEEIGQDEIRIYCASQYRTVHNKLKSLAKHHDNVFIEAKFTKKVTHMIVDANKGVCESSVDVLQGIVTSIWIISSDWVTVSSEDKLESFNTYEITAVGAKSNKGPRNSRYNKYKQLPGIFDGCHFYLHNFNVKYEVSKSLVLNKTILTKLISDAGGVVLRRVPNPELIPESETLVPYHARKDSKLYNCSHYIIFKDMYEPMYNMQHLKALPIGWLIECIEKYELCEPW